MVIMGKKHLNSIFVNCNRDEFRSSVLTAFVFPRQRISKEEIPEVRTTIKELEAAWDRKWMDTLRDTPLVSFLNDDPVSGLLDFLV